MRLVNCHTLQLEDFGDDEIPRYAILSHRWQDEEVLFQDVVNGRASEKAGYQKLVKASEKAKERGLAYLWNDTCCIDKSSSAELSESINSMYRWYRDSEVCLAYLYDFSNGNGDKQSTLGESEWFSRGYTLQELIAPARVEFYDQNWHMFGTKFSLNRLLSRITGIKREVLTMQKQPWDFSIAQRMSWAAGRRTTRTEDVAYSLLGLFDVNMPMLYGEGTKAFRRLQEEIMKYSSDHSLFAWKMRGNGYTGMFAESPEDFAQCGLVSVGNSKTWNRIPYSLSNMGLSIELPMVPWAMDAYLAALDCFDDRTSERICIFLSKLPDSNFYVRCRVDGDCSVKFTDVKGNITDSATYKQVYVKTHVKPMPVVEELPLPDKLFGFWIKTPTPWADQHCGNALPVQVISRYEWDDDSRLIQIPHGLSGLAAIIKNPLDTKETWEIGFDFDFRPKLRISSESLIPFAESSLNNYGRSWVNEAETDLIERRGGSMYELNRSHSFEWKFKKQVVDRRPIWVIELSESEASVKKRKRHFQQEYRRNHGRNFFCHRCRQDCQGPSFRCTRSSVQQFHQHKFCASCVKNNGALCCKACVGPDMESPHGQLESVFCYFLVEEVYCGDEFGCRSCQSDRKVVLTAVTMRYADPAMRSLLLPVNSRAQIADD